MKLRAAILLALLWSPLPAMAKGHSHGHHGRRHRCETCVRDSRGRIRRDRHARQAFMRATGYPHGRKGFVVDHVVPLECGGADAPWNMAWQSIAEAKAKDRTESECRR